MTEQTDKDGAPSVRHSESAPSVRHSESAPSVRHSESAPEVTSNEPPVDTIKNEEPLRGYSPPEVEPVPELDGLQVQKNHFYKRKRDYYGYSAGILPYFIKNKTIFFLLGKDINGKWSDFGGRSEVTDNGRWDITASREFFEETIGSVMDIPTAMTKLQLKKNLRIQDKTGSGYPYYMYVIKVPYKDNYRHTFSASLALLRHINNYDNRIDHKYFEKTDIQWISVDVLEKSIIKDNEYPLRPMFKKTLESSIQKIKLFCTNSTETVF